MENLVHYDWMDVLGTNKYAEPLFKKRGLKLKNLSKVRKYNFLRTDFSKEELTFFLEDILSKVSASRRRDASFAPHFPDETARKELLKYEEIIGINPIESSDEFYGNLKVIKSFVKFEKENIRDLYFNQYLILGKPAFNLFIITERFKEKCNGNFDFFDPNNGGLKLFYSLKISSSIQDLVKNVNILYENSKAIDSMEQATGKSFSEIEQIINFHNNYRNS